MMSTMIQISKKELFVNLVIFIVSCVSAILILFYSFGFEIPIFESAFGLILLMSPIFIYYVYLNYKTTKQTNKLIQNIIEKNKT